jgi:AcrR family transcriptional regulator
MKMKTLDPVLHQIKKESILQSARHLFATKGYAETSVDDIAQTCHIQKASLYHYFDGKQQMLQEMANAAVVSWNTRLPEYAKGSDLKETLRLIATTFLKDMEDPSRREFFKLLHFESHKNPSILKAWKESPMNNREGFYAIFARHLQGHMSRQKIAIFITQFMGALVHYIGMAKLRGENFCLEKFEDADFVEQLVETFARGAH